MRIKSKVRMFGSDRKVVEIPISVREQFTEGEEVVIVKIGDSYDTSKSY